MLRARHIASVGMIALVACAAPQDDDQTPVVIPAYNEGEFSFRIFEMKTDSTFRYWRNISGHVHDTYGSWQVVRDTFLLLADDKLQQELGRIAMHDSTPAFIWTPSDSALSDMANPNCHLVYHNPPENLNFGVRR